MTLNIYEKETYPVLMTESELFQFLRLDVIGKGKPKNIIDNLKRLRKLPCIHISRQPLYPSEAVRQWILEQAQKNR